MKRTAKRITASLLVLVVLFLVFIAVRHELNNRARKRRQEGYELALRRYSEALQPGMNRQAVEDYLRKKNIPLQRMCCVQTHDSDLIKIAQEDPPWFCDASDVYVALQFDGRESSGAIREPNDSDTLKKITIFHRPGNCL